MKSAHLNPKRLSHFRHFLKAKGRHGTHSPFVYAFVEQVMRRKIPPADAIGISEKAFMLLQKCVDYLNPGRIEAVGERLQKVITESTLNNVNNNSSTSILLLIDYRSDFSLVYKKLQERRPGEVVYILFYLPHAGDEAYAQWCALYHEAPLVMALDFWHWGLIAADDAFKTKQYFYLR